MSYQVEPVLEWYEKEGQSLMDKFMSGRFKDTETARKFREFKEIFVDNHDLSLMVSICSSMDVGFGQAMLGGVPTVANLYQRWKEKTAWRKN